MEEEIEDFLHSCKKDRVRNQGHEHRLVSIMKQDVKGRLRKNKEGVWGVSLSEEADVKMFNSL